MLHYHIVFVVWLGGVFLGPVFGGVFLGRKSLFGSEESFWLGGVFLGLFVFGPDGISLRGALEAWGGGYSVV